MLVQCTVTVPWSKRRVWITLRLWHVFSLARFLSSYPSLSLRLSYSFSPSLSYFVSFFLCLSISLILSLFISPSLSLFLSIPILLLPYTSLLSSLLAVTLHSAPLPFFLPISYYPQHTRHMFWMKHTIMFSIELTLFSTSLFHAALLSFHADSQDVCEYTHLNTKDLLLSQTTDGSHYPVTAFLIMHFVRKY